MSQTYFAILTAVGEAKLANAAALNVPLQISRMAVGDGGGVLPTPDRLQSVLVGEQYRADLNELKPDPLNASQIIAELVIPEATGGWWLREMGLYDAAGDLVAVSNCPPSYKPQMAEGSGRTQVLRMVLIVSSTAAVQLKIDPSVVLATRAYVDSAKAAAIAAAGAMIVVHMEDSDPHPQYVNETELAAAIAAIKTVPTGYFTGLTLGNSAATPASDIDIAPGLARSASDTATLKLAASMTKRLQSAGAWAAGSGSNGLFNGARANNTWYHVFLIRKDTDGAIDAGFDTSISAANRPAGWTEFKRITSVKTDSSGNIIQFLHTGRMMLWKTPQLDVDLVGSAVDAAYVLSVPPGVRVVAKLGGALLAGEAFWSYRATDGGVIVPSYAAYVGGVGIATSSNECVASEVTVLTDTTAQAHFRTEYPATSFRVVTYGWTEL